MQCPNQNSGPSCNQYSLDKLGRVAISSEMCGPLTTEFSRKWYSLDKLDFHLNMQYLFHSTNLKGVIWTYTQKCCQSNKCDKIPGVHLLQYTLQQNRGLISLLIFFTHLYLQVAGDLLKRYQDKFKGGTLTVTWNYLRESMSSYLSQPNPVTARWEGEDHLRDPKFQLDAFRVSQPYLSNYYRGQVPT